MRSHRLAVLITGALLTSCSGSAAPANEAAASGAPVPTEDPSILAALPECSTPPPAAADVEVEGLTLPKGSVVTQVTPQKPLVNVNSYVPLTPAVFEAAFTTMDGVEVLFSENEIFEAEMLISTGEHRNFHKASASCQRGSMVLTVVAPEVDAQGLPLPAGATAAPIP